MGLRLTGLREAIADHEEWARRARDLRPVLHESAVELEHMIADAWAQRRSPGGEAWAPTKRPSESTGALATAHEIVVDRHRISIAVPSAHAAAQFFGTARQPARNPLPVEPQGGELVWMQRGPAGAWLERMLARVREHLTASEAA